MTEVGSEGECPYSKHEGRSEKSHQGVLDSTPPQAEPTLRAWCCAALTAHVTALGNLVALVLLFSDNYPEEDVLHIYKDKGPCILRSKARALWISSVSPCKGNRHSISCQLLSQASHQVFVSFSHFCNENTPLPPHPAICCADYKQTGSGAIKLLW